MLLFVSEPKFSVKHGYFYLRIINKNEIKFRKFLDV